MIDTNKLIGGMSAAIVVLGGIVWQNLNSSISDLATNLKDTRTELKESRTDLQRELQETTRTIGQMKEDLAVVRTKLEYVSPRMQNWPTSPSAVGTSSGSVKPNGSGSTSSEPADKQ